MYKRQTLNVYNYRIKKYIGAYAAAMGGCDILVWTGGVGENQWATRRAVCENMEYMGMKIDVERLSMLMNCPVVETSALKQTGLDKLIAASYRLLGLISYLTAGEPEVRAWTITEGTKAPQAAGKIHSDFERGFIRAEVVSYDDLIACGSHTAAKEKGLIRLEGKDYVVKDGDIMLFRFNV